MKYITSADLQALLREGKKELVLGEQDKLTDVVREMIRHHGIRIVRTGAAPVPQASAIMPPAAVSTPGVKVSAVADMGSGQDYDLIIVNGMVCLPESGRMQTNVCIPEREDRDIDIRASLGPAGDRRPGQICSSRHH